MSLKGSNFSPIKVKGKGDGTEESPLIEQPEIFLTDSLLKEAIVELKKINWYLAYMSNTHIDNEEVS